MLANLVISMQLQKLCTVNHPTVKISSTLNLLYSPTSLVPGYRISNHQICKLICCAYPRRLLHHRHPNSCYKQKVYSNLHAIGEAGPFSGCSELHYRPRRQLTLTGWAQGQKWTITVSAANPTAAPLHPSCKCQLSPWWGFQLFQIQISWWAQRHLKAGTGGKPDGHNWLNLKGKN